MHATWIIRPLSLFKDTCIVSETSSNTIQQIKQLTWSISINVSLMITNDSIIIDTDYGDNE